MLNYHRVNGWTKTPLDEWNKPQIRSGMHILLWGWGYIYIYLYDYIYIDSPWKLLIEWPLKWGYLSQIRGHLFHRFTWICCGFTHLMSNQWEGGCLIGLSSDWVNIQPSSPCEHTVPMSGMIKMALGLLKVTMGFTTWLDGLLKKHPKDCVTVSIPNVSGNWDLPSDIRMNIKPEFYSNVVNVSLKIVLWFSL